MSDLNATFGALRDETRRAMLQRLMSGEARLSDLAEPFNMSQTAVSKHARILQEAGLIAIERRAGARYCKLNATELKVASDWLVDFESFWSEELQNLALFLNEDGEAE